MFMATPRLAPLTFDDLAQRLVRELGKLVHSGAVTERRLAAMVGLSQSHLHNVVNGMRKLTSTVADQIMLELEWSALDLVESAEARALLLRREASLAHGREIPICGSAVGLGFSLPGIEFGEISVPNSWLARAEAPVAVSASEDQAMDSVISERDILLIDCAPSIRQILYEDALYIVNISGQSIARWLRFSSRGFYLVTAYDWSEPHRWILLTIPASRRMEVIEGKVIALARPPDGRFHRLLPPSVSS